MLKIPHPEDHLIVSPALRRAAIAGSRCFQPMMRSDITTWTPLIRAVAVVGA